MRRGGGTLLGLAVLGLATACLATACHGAPGSGTGEPPAATAEAAAKPEHVTNPAIPAPAPPQPAVALNHFAESCLHEAPPATAEGAGERAAACFGDVLESLRAAIGVGQLAQAEVGPDLDAAELAVQGLGDDPTAEDAAARSRQAADALAALAESVNAALATPRPEVQRHALQAIDGLSTDRPLADQGAALLAVFRALDAVVRPLAQQLSIEPSPAPAGGD